MEEGDEEEGDEGDEGDEGEEFDEGDEEGDEEEDDWSKYYISIFINLSTINIKTIIIKFCLW